MALNHSNCSNLDQLELKGLKYIRKCWVHELIYSNLLHRNNYVLNEPFGMLILVPSSIAWTRPSATFCSVIRSNSVSWRRLDGDVKTTWVPSLLHHVLQLCIHGAQKYYHKVVNEILKRISKVELRNSWRQVTALESESSRRWRIHEGDEAGETTWNGSHE